MALDTATPAAPTAPAAVESNPFDALDARIGFEPKAEPKPPAREPATPEPEEPTEVADPEVAETEEPQVKPDTNKPAPIKAKTEGGKLRENLERQSARVKELEAKIAEKEKAGGDSTALTERLAAVEKERDDARQEAAMARQEKSPQFIEKWEKPFADAAESAKDLIGQFVVSTPEGERPANWEKDFGSIYNLPYPAAKARALEMFGDEAPMVMNEWNKLHQLEKTASKAWESEKAGFADRQKAQAAEQAKWQEARKAGYAAGTDGWVKKFPDRYGEDPNDKDGNDLFKRGLAAVDAAPKTFQEEVAKNTRVRLAAAAEPRYLRKIATLTKELTEAKAKIAGLAGSKPGGGKVTGLKPGSEDVTPIDRNDILSAFK
jgi:hypothetical protein